MKKYTMIVILAMLWVFGAGVCLAQITGTMEINFQSRAQSGEAGVSDLYKIDLNCANAFAVAGNVTHLPTLLSATLGRETQPGKLTYDLSMRVFNPANPAQSKTVGKLVGAVPVDKNGVYQYQNGNLRMAVDAAGSAAEFSSAYRGTIQGLPVSDDSILGKASKESKKLTKMVGGKQRTILLTQYDSMRFQGLVLPAGPVKKYAEATVTGEMLFDYERSAWYFNGVQVGPDKITGNIKWVPHPSRASNGQGVYEFDIRVNEPEGKGVDEAAVFDAADDEAAFFAVDVSIPSLTGTVDYKDQMSGDTVLRSEAKWNLTQNQLTVAQQANLLKLLLTCIVPFNAE